MNPHRATVSDRAPRVADVVAPERGLSTGRYRAGRARDKGRHHPRPSRASRLFPKWAIPKVVAIVATSTVVVSTVVVVAVVASGGGTPAASPTTTTVAVTTAPTEPNTTISTSTTVALASFWSTLAGTYTGNQKVNKAYTAGFGFVTPKVDMTTALQVMVPGGCTTLTCTVSAHQPSSTEPPVVLDVALVGDSLHVTKTELIACLDGTAGNESGTWDIMMNVTSHAADGSVSGLEGTGTLRVAQINGCSGSAPVDWYITWTFTRAS